MKSEVKFLLFKIFRDFEFSLFQIFLSPHRTSSQSFPHIDTIDVFSELALHLHFAACRFKPIWPFTTIDASLIFCFCF